MSDLDLREAERRYRESGAEEAAEHYLRLLGRAGRDVEALLVQLERGRLERNNLQLAAYLGSERAREALAQIGAEVVLGPDDFVRWAEGLWRWGNEVCVRGTLAAAELSRAGGALPADWEEALRTAAEWAEEPCDRTYRAAEAYNSRGGGLPSWVYQTVTAAHCPPRLTWQAMQGRWSGCRHYIIALHDLSREHGEDEVRAQVARRLIAWALGPSARLGSAEASWGRDGGLAQAARRGELDAVREFLQQGADPNTRQLGLYTRELLLFDEPEALGTALHAAAYHGREEVVAALLEAGAQLEPRTMGARGWTPLHLAGARGALATIELLLAAGADPRAEHLGHDGLSLAASQRQPEAVERLLEDPVWEPGRLARALRAAVRARCGGALERLLPRVDSRAPELAEELLLSARTFPELTRALLEAGFADTLASAAARGEAETLARLLDEGASLPEVYPVAARGPEVCAALLAAGLAPSRAAFLAALAREDAQSFELLLAAGAPAGTLSDLCREGHLAAAERVLGAGADPAEEGGLPLSYATLHGSAGAALVRLLLAAGADPRGCAAESPPLVRAAWDGALEVVVALLEAGADPGATDHDGQTALDVARELLRGGSRFKAREQRLAQLVERLEAASGAS